MRRLLAIAVMGAVAVLPGKIEAQLRRAPGIRVAPSPMRAEVPFARPALSRRIGGTPLRFASPGRIIAPKPGLPGGFAPRRFSSRHLIGLGNLRFFLNQCFSIFNPFFCDNFFFDNFIFHRFSAFSPFFSVPVLYPQTQAYAAPSEQQNELAQEVAELGQEIQQMREAETEPEHEPAQPLMIEKEDDRFVRVDQAGLRTVRSQREGRHAAGQLPTTILVFRDGRRMEINGYTIVDRMLYAYADQAGAGYWTKQISLADLDLAVTIKLNEERGVRFVLPTAPNEVITRP